MSYFTYVLVFFDIFADYINVSVSSWHSFIFTAQEGPTIYLINNNSPVFQVLTCTAKAAMKTLYSIIYKHKRLETFVV